MAIKTQQVPKTLKLCYRAFGTAGFAGFVLCLAILAHAQERDSPWQTEPYKTWEGWITTMGPMTHVVVNPDAPPTPDQHTIRWPLQRVYLLIREISLECADLGSDVRAFDRAATKVAGTHWWLENGKYAAPGSEAGSVLSPEFWKLRTTVEATHARDQMRFCRAMYDRLKKNGDLAKVIDQYLTPHLDAIRSEPQLLWHAQEVCRAPGAYYQGIYGFHGPNELSQLELREAIENVCVVARETESTWGKIP